MTPIADYSTFAHSYINAVSTGYNYAFGVTAFAMLVSMLVYVGYRKYLAPGDFNSKSAAAQGMKVESISPAETKNVLPHWVCIFVVISSGWLSTRMDLTLNQFAKDYTVTR